MKAYKPPPPKPIEVQVRDLEALAMKVASPRLLLAGMSTHLDPRGDFYLQIHGEKGNLFCVRIRDSHGGDDYAIIGGKTLPEALESALELAERALGARQVM